MHSSSSGPQDEFLVQGGEPVGRCARVLDEIYRVGELVLDVRRYSFEIWMSARCPDLGYRLQELFRCSNGIWI